MFISVLFVLLDSNFTNQVFDNHDFLTFFLSSFTQPSPRSHPSYFFSCMILLFYIISRASEVWLSAISLQISITHWSYFFKTEFTYTYLAKLRLLVYVLSSDLVLSTKLDSFVPVWDKNFLTFRYINLTSAFADLWKQD